LLQKYYNGKLSDAEKNALEQRALEDPFLKEAMDGFDEHPNSFNQFHARHIKGNTALGKTMLIAISVLVGMSIMVYLVNQNIEEPSATNDIALMDSLASEDFVEVEVLPTAIETLVVANEEDLIAIEEIVENKILIEKEHQTDINQNDEDVEHPIEIDARDDHIEDEDFHPEDEHYNQNLENSAAATYLHDMYVVDYREISRKKKYISYLRYDLPGLSADFESEEAERETELIEREVRIPYMTYLEKGMSYFADRKYKRALNCYSIILEQYDDDINALFYGGLCYYNTSKYSTAISQFDQILTHELNAFKEEAKWYKAKALVKLNKTSEAQIILDEIIVAGGFYTKDAIMLKKSL
jgi:tetratricopeptide (TPR) repeat protein